MAQFDRQIATAKRLIKKYGQAVQWRSISDDVKDPIEPWKVLIPGVQTDKPVSICFVPVDRQSLETLAFVRNTELSIGSVVGLMGAVQGFTPSLKDVVIRGSEMLRIENIDILSPNGQLILYTVLFKS